MIINEIGKYKLVEDFTTRNAFSIATLKAGTELNITQIDNQYHKVIGEPLMDWTYWDIPVIGVDISIGKDFSCRTEGYIDMLSNSHITKHTIL
jgi:hypothetical protein